MRQASDLPSSAKRTVATAEFRSDIQGLRAFAVSSVLIGHAFPDVLTGGYVGVDIFFVISGFLIAGIIIRDIEQHRFSFSGFYRRRIRRILPALTVVTLSTFIAGYFALGPRAYQEEARNVASTMLFVSNFDFWQLTGYFDGAAELKPLLHMWSLAVEEQFYIFFPPLLWLIWPRLGRRRSATIIAALAAASVVMAELMRTRSAAAAYFLLPGRIFEFLLGALLATGALPPLAPRLRSAIALLGFALMLSAAVFYSPATPFPGVTALLPCLGAILVIHAGQTTGSSPVGWFLATPPVRFIGDRSYSLYLWHWPILAYLRNLGSIDLGSVQAIGAIFASGVAAALSFEFVERRFLQDRLRGFPFFAAGAAVVAAFGVLASVVSATDGLPGRFTPWAQALFAAADDHNSRRDQCHDGGVGIPMPYRDNCVWGRHGVRPDLAVWGDSHGAELVVALGRRADGAGRSVMEITSSACPPAMDFALPERPGCRERNRRSLEGLVSDGGIKTVVMTANSARYPDKLALERGMGASVSALLASGKRVILVKQIPVMPASPPAVAGVYAERGFDLSALGFPVRRFQSEASPYNGFIDSLRSKAGVSAFDPADVLCDAKTCHAFSAAAGMLYFDEDHLSVRGASFTFASLADEIYGASR